MKKVYFVKVCFICFCFQPQALAWSFVEIIAKELNNNVQLTNYTCHLTKLGLRLTRWRSQVWVMPCLTGNFSCRSKQFKENLSEDALLVHRPELTGQWHVPPKKEVKVGWRSYQFFQLFSTEIMWINYGMDKSVCNETSIINGGTY